MSKKKPLQKETPSKCDCFCYSCQRECHKPDAWVGTMSYTNTWTAAPMSLEDRVRLAEEEIEKLRAKQTAMLIIFLGGFMVAVALALI